MTSARHHPATSHGEIPAAPPVADILAGARVVVCVGPGGVGKTSISASIAMDAAFAGRRTIVLTIDPARRLATALGLPEIGNEERIISDEAFATAGRPPPRKPLSAMMLDIKRTWDQVVHRYHPDPERRARLLNNRFYHALSTALAGSQEYMAMEKLYELSERRTDPLDLIVLDTPPAANAVDFLEAPSRMIDALDNDATRWLLEPYTSAGRMTRGLFDAGSSFFLRTIGRFTGVETLQELAELLACFQGMYDGFRDRAKAVRAILADPNTVFMIIGAPRAGPIADARAFYRRLREENIRVGGFVLNRATVDPFESGERPVELPVLERAVVNGGGSPDLARRLLKIAEEARAAAHHERVSADQLRRMVPGTPVVVVPELPTDVHDLKSLDALRQHLFTV